MGFLNLSKSAVKRELLTLFFLNPERQYYLRETERMINRSAGSIRRELLKLVEDGILTTEKKGNLLYYGINKKYPLISELKSIIKKTLLVENILKQEITKHDKISTAFIYGSFAKDNMNKDSDIDIMIVGEPDPREITKAVMSLEKKLNKEINVSIYSKSEFHRKKVENSQFIKDVLSNKIIYLKGRPDDL
jgi:predicted nucleotidyltransferase